MKISRKSINVYLNSLVIRGNPDLEIEFDLKDFRIWL